MKYLWETAFGKEFGNLAQGDNGTGEKGTNSICVMTPEEIRNIPNDRAVTCARVVINYRPQKDDPTRVRITAGGNLIIYPDELTTRGADMTTSKMLLNSTISTKRARHKCIDIGSFYLKTPMKRFEYMKFPIRIFPQYIINQCNLLEKVHNGYIYVEIINGIYGLPQA